jgi:hypothetical protein
MFIGKKASNAPKFKSRPMSDSPLKIGNKITCLPVVHGSADCARIVRRRMLEGHFDCVAVVLPESFRREVLEAIPLLPTPSLVLQRTLSEYGGQWDKEQEDNPAWSYVPIDPCQPVIVGLRIAQEERLPIHFIDLETNAFQPQAEVMPDPYALKMVPLEKFATAVLPSISRPSHEQTVERLKYMASRLRLLQRKFHNILLICSIQEWPWLRESFFEFEGPVPEGDLVEPPTIYCVNPNSLIFMFGELPFIAGLHEQARAQLDDDENLTLDGVKQLLMSARSSYLQDLGKRARRITPLHLKQCLKYIRNLTLLEHRMTPNLYTIALAAKQVMGDQYTIHLVATARHYAFHGDAEAFQSADAPYQQVTLGIDQLRLPSEETVSVVSRLPGPPIIWRQLELRRPPLREERLKWVRQWDPNGQCSWPPEDTLIESFRTRVIDRANAIIGADLARSEKFSTSIKDGIDIRETLRHWYDGDIYVKVLPPSVGTMDCCVMLFDTPAEPDEYPWRTTWFAEHNEESTLAFFATDFQEEMVGPGIALATYGGAMFLYPPVMIPNIWFDPRLAEHGQLESRLIAAACLHSRQNRIALLSERAPGAEWRRIAKRQHKQLVHIPMSHFNDALVKQLRMVHVLNGTHIRSYADRFIRKA